MILQWGAGGNDWCVHRGRWETGEANWREYLRASGNQVENDRVWKGGWEKLKRPGAIEMWLKGKVNKSKLSHEINIFTRLTSNENSG